MGFNSGFKGLRETAVLTAAHRTDGRTDPVSATVGYSTQIAGQFGCLKSTGQVSLCAVTVDSNCVKQLAARWHLNWLTAVLGV